MSEFGWTRRFGGSTETTHERPTPGDTYCNNCGLMGEFWEKVPGCPAVEAAVEVVKEMLEPVCLCNGVGCNSCEPQGRG
jgi:hypothetical protein